MTTQNATCPPDAALSDFGLGKLDAASAETVSQHLETCTDCRQRVASLSGDSFVGRLREARPKTPVRARTFVPGESLANASNSTDGSIAKEDGLPRPSRPSRDTISRDGLGSPSSISRDGLGSPSSVAAPPELANHPDFELVKELGQGGMGTVYLAKNRMMDRLEVLKVISTALLDRAGALERFQQEIRAAAKLNHPNIVAAHSVSRPGNLLVFAMEYVRGQDLSQVVKARGPLPVANAAFYTHQVALGLQHAHEKGMVHRDIKPNNLMLTIEGKKHVVKILDFGLSKATSEKDAGTGLTKSGQMLGTPDYIAPEQTLDAHRADIRADIYSLGCTLYALLTGGPPFQESSLYGILEAHQKREARLLNLVRPEVPAELAAVVAKMMAKNPQNRYQTPQEVARALVPFFKPGQSVPPPSPTNASHPPSTGETADAMAATTPPPLAAPPIAVALPMAARIAMPLPPADTAESVDHFSLSIDTQRPAASRGTRSSARRAWRMPHLPRYVWAILAGLLPPVVLLIAGLVFSFKTSEGTVVVEVNVENPEIFIDGDRATVTWEDGGKRAEISIAPGSHEIELTKDGFRAYGKKVAIETGGQAMITARLKPVKPDPGETDKTAPALVNRPDATRADGWVSLFNGTDLTGWYEPEQNKGTWQVVNGVLIGRGGADKSLPTALASRRRNFADLKLRLEILCPPTDMGQVIVRAPALGGHPDGYDGYRVTLVQGRHRSGGEYNAGSINRAVGLPLVWTVPAKSASLSNSSYIVEIHVLGKTITSFVEGTKVAEYEDQGNLYPSGQIRLVCRYLNELAIRRIEVNELARKTKELGTGVNIADRKREAEKIVQTLSSVVPLKADVIESIKRDGTLSREVRDEALRLAEGIKDDASRLNAAAWPIVVRRDAKPDDYRRALRCAEAAYQLRPDDGNLLNTLGVAHYRAGQFEQALPALTQSTELNEDDGEPRPADVAFLALTHHALGHAADAQTLLQRLRDLAAQALWQNDAETKAFLAEAEEVIGSASNPAVVPDQQLADDMEDTDDTDDDSDSETEPPKDGGAEPEKQRVAKKSTRRGKSIDLLKQLNLKQPGTVGEWRMEKGALVFPQVENPSLAIYDGATDEYTIKAVVECPSHVGAFFFGIVVGNSQAIATIDSHGKTYSGLGLVNGLPHRENGTGFPGCFIIDGTANKIECTVRKNRVQLSCNGQALVDWADDPDLLSVIPAWAGRHGKRQLFIGMAAPSPYRVTKLTLTPLGMATEKAAKSAREKKPKRTASRSKSDGWVPLFDGKDLKHWEMPPENRGTWNVEGGILVGRGGRQTGWPAHLATTRKNFKDFQLRIEVVYPRINLATIFVRARTDGQSMDGYRIALNSGQSLGGARLPVFAGSINRSVAAPMNSVIDWHVPAKEVPIPDSPYVIEMRVAGKTITTFLDGVELARYDDPESHFTNGELRIVCSSVTELGLRRIDIKEEKP